MKKNGFWQRKFIRNLIKVADTTFLGEPIQLVPSNETRGLTLAPCQDGNEREPAMRFWTIVGGDA